MTGQGAIAQAFFVTNDVSFAFQPFLKAYNRGFSNEPNFNHC